MKVTHPDHPIHARRAALVGDMNRRIRKRLGPEFPGRVTYVVPGTAQPLWGYWTITWPDVPEEDTPFDPAVATRAIFLGRAHCNAAPRLTALINEQLGLDPGKAAWRVLRDVVIPEGLRAASKVVPGPVGAVLGAVGGIFGLATGTTTTGETDEDEEG